MSDTLSVIFALITYFNLLCFVVKSVFFLISHYFPLTSLDFLVAVVAYLGYIQLTINMYVCMYHVQKAIQLKGINQADISFLKEAF